MDVPAAPDVSDVPQKDAPAHVPVLDGLRGLLTLLVLVHHVVSSVLFAVPLNRLPEWRAAMTFAYGTTITLPMYFVISGFVIYLPAARGNGKLGELSWYAVRRAARIVPAYYLNIAVLLLAWPFLFPEAPSPMASRRGIELVLGHLSFLQKALFDESDIGFGLNGSVWTLTLEEFFYATIPFLALPLFKHPYRLLAASFVVSLGWRLASFFTPELAALLGLSPPDSLLPSHLFHQFPGYLFQFAVGSVAAIVYVRYWDAPFFVQRSRLLNSAHAVSLVLIGFSVWRIGNIRHLERGLIPDFTYDMVPAALFAVLILAVAMGPRAPRKLYDNRVCRFLGDVSYGVYLWHMVLIQIVYRYAGLPAPPDVRSVLVYLAWVVPGALLLGWLSFRFVERPFSAWVRRVRGALRKSGTEALPTAV